MVDFSTITIFEIEDNLLQFLAQFRETGTFTEEDIISIEKNVVELHRKFKYSNYYPIKSGLTYRDIMYLYLDLQEAWLGDEHGYLDGLETILYGKEIGITVDSIIIDKLCALMSEVFVMLGDVLETDLTEVCIKKIN